MKFFESNQCKLTQPTLYGIYTVPKNAIASQVSQDIKIAIERGLHWLQIRDKYDQRRLWPLWVDIAQLCQSHKVQLIVNDHIDLLLYLLEKSAISISSPGLHIGQDDLTIQQARPMLPSSTIIGVTCHNSVQLAQQAAALGASYVAFGRFFKSSTKPLAATASPDTVVECQHQLPTTPIAVIGGITTVTLQKLLPLNAQLYAVSGAIWHGSVGIGPAVEALLAQLEMHSTHDSTAPSLL